MRLLICGAALLISILWAHAESTVNEDGENLSRSLQTLDKIAVGGPDALEKERARQGDEQIELAKELIAQKNYADAYKYLLEGLLRSPKNIEGRLLLSEFYISREPERAIKILSAGMPYAHGNAEYLKRYFSFLLRDQKDAEVIELSEAILADEPNNDIVQLAASASATAHLYRGQFADAERLVREYELEKDISGLLLSARILWEKGEQEAALAKLTGGLDQYETNEPLYAHLSKFHRERGELEKALSYALKRQEAAPLSVAPSIDLLYIRLAMGQDELAEQEAFAIARNHQNDEKAMLMLSNYATDEGQVGLAQSLLGLAQKEDFNEAPFALLTVETHISAGDYASAIAFSEELIERQPEWLERSMPILNGLRAVAHHGAGNKEQAEACLNDFLQAPYNRVESLLAVERRLSALGGEALAQRVLAKAYEENPNNQAALTRLIELEIKMGETAQLPSHVRELLTMRRPDPTVLQLAYDELSREPAALTPDDRALLEKLRVMLSATQ